jgi:nucleoside-diphosphate-sugar epimerase
MRVFLTGATGYIGTIVMQHLLKAGYEVIALARSDAAAAKVMALGATPHRGDLRDLERLKAGALAADAVIHTAQERYNPALGVEGMVDMTQTNLRALQVFIDALRGTDKVLITTSGTGAYGDTGGTVVDEEKPILAEPPMDGFARAEQLVLESGQHGIRGVVIRPGIVYGQSRTELGPVGMWVMAAHQSGKAAYVGTGENVISTVHVDDLAELYRLALEKAPAGTLVNAVSEPWPQVRDVMEAISHAVGLNGETFSVTPEEAFQSMGFGARLLMYNMRVSGARAKALLGWQPRQPALIDVLHDGSYVAALQPVGEAK